MLSREPYGGTSICYPNYEKSDGAKAHAEAYYSKGTTRFININNECWGTTVGHHEHTMDYLANNGLPAGRMFVIMITCSYPFSSSLVKWLFNGGSNTKIWETSKDGGLYLLWARGVGIVNAK